MKDEDAVLCYVRDRMAWFTTTPLDEQWGDDWDDAPYESNAGRPYDHDKPGSLSCLMFDVDMDEPCDGHMNSSYSVKAINAGNVAWLRGKLPINAGVTRAEFIRRIAANGGTVYAPLESSAGS